MFDVAARPNLLRELRATFGFDGFRPLQQEVVEAILAGRDTFVLMPTGGGKSLCYQLPALVMDGLTVVISPLIALMQDQVDRLQAMGVAATFLNSSISPAESRARQTAVRRGEVKLLYVAPERLVMPGLLELLASVKLSLFVVDEAHCVSEWGFDFRPEYRAIGGVRRQFGDVPMAAFTATATTRVQGDVLVQLGLRDPVVFRAGFNRPNLKYAVRPKEAATEWLRAFVHERPGAPGIVYCATRATTETVAERLQRDGIKAVAYHAGLEAEDRRKRQAAFLRDQVQVVVATIAFGMGIDHPSVRWVVHHDLPKSLEGYYQESGRAGRDGEPAECILLYSYADAAKVTHWIEQQPPGIQRDAAMHQLRKMLDWADASTCRRKLLLEYFGDSFDGQEDCCDNCDSPPETEDYTVEAQKLLSAVKRTGERFGLGHVVDVVHGNPTERIVRLGHDRLPTFGVGADRPVEEWQHIGRELVRAGHLTPVGEYNVLAITESGTRVLFGREAVALPRPKPRTKPSRKRGKGGETAAPPTSAEAALFDRLRALRKQLADERNVPAYVVFPDATLRQMASLRPRSKSELLRISGVGEKKLADFGDAFVAEIERYRSEHGDLVAAEPRAGQLI